MTVWHLIATMRTERETLEGTARNFGLPLEAVLEATHYYVLHKDIVEADTEDGEAHSHRRIRLSRQIAMSVTTYSDNSSDNLPKDTQTDWDRVKIMTETEIDEAAASDPDAQPTDEAFWKDAKVVIPQSKHAISLRVDSDVLAWFKSQGRGYQTRINAVLRGVYGSAALG